MNLQNNSTRFPVRILNLSTEEMPIKKDTMLGKLEEVIKISPLVEKETLKSKPEFSKQKFKVSNVAIKREMPDHLTELFAKSSKNLNLDQKSRLQNLLYDNSDLFASSPSDLGKASVAEHKINTGDAKPIKQQARRSPRILAGKEEDIIHDQLKAGVIRESTSPWASPMVYVMKKDGSIRPCVDYRRLNDITLKDAYPLPKINDCLDNFGDAKFLSTLDLQSGYWQIAVAEEDKPKTAFITRSGLYEYNTMPFGLCNAPYTFKRCMKIEFSGLQWKILLIYLDDIIIFSETFETHLDRIRQVFKRLKAAGFKLKPSKCELFRSEVTFLGHLITRNGIRPSPDKVKVMQCWKRPQTVTQVRSFLGFASYYRCYIKDFSVRVAP